MNRSWPATASSAAAAAAALFLGSIVLATPAIADEDDPPGNNGFVKVNDQELDDIPNNDPHENCIFNVDFYNYDLGDYEATVEFSLKNPTLEGRTLEVISGDLTPFIGEDEAGGGDDFDARETYTLEFTGDPHPMQGYHVKLRIHAPGSIGNDTKHKVFWVQPCEDETPSPTPAPSETPVPSSPPSDQPPTEQPPGEQPPGEQPSPDVPTVVPAGAGSAGTPPSAAIVGTAAGTALALALGGFIMAGLKFRARRHSEI